MASVLECASCWAHVVYTIGSTSNSSQLFAVEHAVQTVLQMLLFAGFMLQNPDDAVIWRGPRKNALIKQFLKDVDWGDIDYLVVDAPPG